MLLAQAALLTLLQALQGRLSELEPQVVLGFRMVRLLVILKLRRQEEVHLQRQEVLPQQQEAQLQRREVRLQRQEALPQQRGLQLQQQVVRLQRQVVHLQRREVL